MPQGNESPVEVTAFVFGAYKSIIDVRVDEGRYRRVFGGVIVEAVDDGRDVIITQALFDRYYPDIMCLFRGFDQ